MGECPFCKGAVSSELLRDGGRCPHCLIEIPGEETPTNPGEPAAAAGAPAGAAAAPPKSKAPVVAAAAVVVLALGGAGAWALLGGSPPDDVAVDAGDDFVIVPLSAHQDLADPAAAEAAAAEAAAPKSGGGAPRAAGTGAPRQARADGAAVADAGSAAAAPEAGPSQSGMVAPPSSGGGNVLANPLGALSSGVGPGARGPQGIVLSDPNEIYEMVQKRMKVGTGQIEQCYTMRLKENESLRGAWTAAWVIEATGRTSKVRVTGDDRADPALEACMKKVIEGWAFQALVEPMAIDKTFRFGR